MGWNRRCGVKRGFNRALKSRLVAGISFFHWFLLNFTVPYALHGFEHSILPLRFRNAHQKPRVAVWVRVGVGEARVNVKANSQGC